jgi:hypothetical protein
MTSAQPTKLRREPNSRSGARSDIMSDIDSYFGWMDGARLCFSTMPSSLSDVEDDPTSESCSRLELELEFGLDGVWRCIRTGRRDLRLLEDFRLGGSGAGKNLTTDDLGFAGGWREIVSVSSDRGTRHVGQRPSEPVADNHYHRI